jgi:hypothetical protein
MAEEIPSAAEAFEAADGVFDVTHEGFVLDLFAGEASDQFQPRGRCSMRMPDNRCRMPFPANERLKHRHEHAFVVRPINNEPADREEEARVVC